MAARIPGHRMPQIEPLHADGTVCEHATAPSGKPRDPDSGCTGRHQYRATCECGWDDHDPIRESLKYARDGHKRKVEAAAAEERRAAAEPQSAARTISITYKGVCREVLYRPEQPISRLLIDAVRAHGLRFIGNAHLRLYRAGGVSPFPVDEHSVGRVGICHTDALDLRPPAPAKEAS